MKQCSTCRESKDLSQFPADSRKPDGRKYRCKLCARTAQKALRAADPERYRGHRRKHLAANREKEREVFRRWRAANLERDRERCRIYGSKRSAADALWYRLKLGAARARRAGSVVESFTSADLLAYWQEDGIAADRCYYSGELLGDDFTLDHMTPLSRGGAHSLENVVPCTPQANRDKWDKTADEYRRELVSA